MRSRRSGHGSRCSRAVCSSRRRSGRGGLRHARKCRKGGISGSRRSGAACGSRRGLAGLRHAGKCGQSSVLRRRGRGSRLSSGRGLLGHARKGGQGDITRGRSSSCGRGSGRLPGLGAKRGACGRGRLRRRGRSHGTTGSSTGALDTDGDRVPHDLLGRLLDGVHRVGRLQLLADKVTAGIDDDEGTIGVEMARDLVEQGNDRPEDGTCLLADLPPVGIGRLRGNRCRSSRLLGSSRGSRSGTLLRHAGKRGQLRGTGLSRGARGLRNRALCHRCGSRRCLSNLSSLGSGLPSRR